MMVGGGGGGGAGVGGGWLCCWCVDEVRVAMEVVGGGCVGELMCWWVVVIEDVMKVMLVVEIKVRCWLILNVHDTVGERCSVAC